MSRTLDELAEVISFDEEERERFMALVAFITAGLAGWSRAAAKTV